MLLRKLVKFLPHFVLFSLLVVGGEYMWVFSFSKIKDILSSSFAHSKLIDVGIMMAMLLSGSLLLAIAKYMAYWLRGKVWQSLAPQVLCRLIEREDIKPAEGASIVAQDVYKLTSFISADASWGPVYFVRLILIIVAIWTLSPQVAIAGTVYSSFTIVYLVLETIWYTKRDYEIDERERKLKAYLADTLDGKEDIHLLNALDREKIFISNKVRDVFMSYKNLFALDYMLGSLVSSLTYFLFVVYVVYMGKSMSPSVFVNVFVYCVLLGGITSEIYGVLSTFQDVLSSGKKVNEVLRK